MKATVLSIIMGSIILCILVSFATSATIPCCEEKLVKSYNAIRTVISAAWGSHKLRKPRIPRGNAHNDGNEDESQNKRSSEEEKGECFPASGVVTLRSGNKVQLWQLAVGDEVAVASNEFSSVFAFAHKVLKTRRSFIRLSTARGNLTATRGHFIFTNSGAKLAASITRNDFLVAADGTFVPVLSTSVVQDFGLFNPLTVAGVVVVDGFRSTCYALDVPVAAAQCLLTPFRWLFQFFHIDILSSVCQHDNAFWPPHVFSNFKKLFLLLII